MQWLAALPLAANTSTMVAVSVHCTHLRLVVSCQGMERKASRPSDRVVLVTSSPPHQQRSCMASAQSYGFLCTHQRGMLQPSCYADFHYVPLLNLVHIHSDEGEFCPERCAQSRGIHAGQQQNCNPQVVGAKESTTCSPTALCAMAHLNMTTTSVLCKSGHCFPGSCGVKGQAGQRVRYPFNTSPVETCLLLHFLAC